MSNWTSGQQLKDGRYIIDKLLGMGGFGVTYSAREQPSGKLVAIKTLNYKMQRKSNFDELQEKFLSEALYLAKCNHPHIVQIYPKLIQQDGVWCMVMEYIDGEDLATYIDEHGALSESEGLRIIKQIGDALTCVHNLGFLHRDVKPHNIILRRDIKDAVLIDFGLAREFTIGQLQSHTNDKTERFAPIEQYERRAERGAYTDVYALAATLYVLLTGELPIAANFRKYEPLIPPKQHNPKISDSVNDAIITGMALEPKDRPQSVQEWLDLLIPKSPEIELITSFYDYTKLRDLLSAKRWKEADKETAKAMLKVAGLANDGALDDEHIDNFPCEDLRTIDQLWVKYSGGRFGFSVQTRIYQSLGGTREYNREIWEALGVRVGWRVNNEWLCYYDFPFFLYSRTPEGHLPWQGVWFEADNFGAISSVISSLALRLVKCNL